MKGKGVLSVLLVVLLAGIAALSGCIPAGTDGEEGGFDWTIIIFLVVIFAIFYFLMIRPQQKRQKQHQQFTQDLKRGDRVVTIGGIYGEIESVNEDSIVLKLESGGTIRISRRAEVETIRSVGMMATIGFVGRLVMTSSTACRARSTALGC